MDELDERHQGTLCVHAVIHFHIHSTKFCLTSIDLAPNEVKLMRLKPLLNMSPCNQVILVRFTIYLFAPSGQTSTVRHLDRRPGLMDLITPKRVVSDSLRFSPEMSTVVATYKKVVVGVAILTSPQETYLTYLAVKAGWENCRIATCV